MNVGSDVFEITFRGMAGPTLTEAFHEYELWTHHGRTTIRGPMRDQADLQAMLDRIFELGLEVLDLHIGTELDC